MAALTRLVNIRSLMSIPYWRRSVQVANYANSSKHNESPAPRDDTIPSDLEQATGLEKKEIDALMAGIEDPFNMGLNTGPWGTKDKPTLVPSMFEERLVGCVCMSIQY
jgi:cytochrome c oxidase subunit 5b